MRTIKEKAISEAMLITRDEGAPVAQSDNFIRQTTRNNKGATP